MRAHLRVPRAVRGTQWVSHQPQSCKHHTPNTHTQIYPYRLVSLDLTRCDVKRSWAFFFSHSARDDPPPLRDAVGQLLLCGQQTGDAQQSRLFLQWGAIGWPPPFTPTCFRHFPWSRYYVRTRDSWTEGQMAGIKHSCLIPCVLLQVVSCLTNRFLPLPLCRNIEFCQFYQQVAWACVWVNVWAANPCIVCTYCWFQTVYVGSTWSSGKHWFICVVGKSLIGRGKRDSEMVLFVPEPTMRQREKCYPK